MMDKEVLMKSQIITSSLQLINRYNGEDIRGPMSALFSDLENLTQPLTNVDDGFKIILLKSRLEGKALEYYHAIYQKSLSYVQIKDLLKKRFQPEPNLQSNYKSLAETRQRSSEDIISYATRLERKVTRLLSPMSGNTPEVKFAVTKFWDDICLAHFIEGLLPNLKGIVMMKEPRTLTQAITEAEKAEEITKQSNNLPLKNISHIEQELVSSADSPEPNRS
ncbi:hypothetical protein GQR58_011948 [Nymphon striatum]|nr:hypothetical protein GQR58_011948 [Nymphon striatum]